ncbi:MAG: wax ester/triacylglycerol synthase family O-acyltransferase [Pseudomonadota bacterium]
MQQLSGIDASFLYLETERTPMHVAGLTLYELPEGLSGSFYEHFREFFEGRVHLVPIFNRKLARTVFELDHPGWVEVDDLDFDYHITKVELGKPGSMEQVEQFVAEIHAKPLDRKKPLWQFTVIEGMEDAEDGTRRAGLYSKVHHAAIDGGAGMLIAQALYDFTPVPREVKPAVQVKLPRKPTVAERAILGTHDVIANVIGQQLKAWEAVPKMMDQMLDGAEKLASGKLGEDLTKIASKLDPNAIGAPKVHFSLTMGKGRTYAARTLRLTDVKAVAKATGTKLNDVVMAICSGALHHYLKGKKKLPTKPLIAFVPVSTREAGNQDMNNQVAGMNIPIATQIADPMERLKAIAGQSGIQKEVVGAVKPMIPADYTVLGAPHLVSALMEIYGQTQLADVVPQAVNLCISNTMGPPFPMYCTGAKVTALYPVSIVTHGVGLNITVQSYCDSMDFGLVGGRRAMPDIADLGDLLQVALDELKEAVAKEAA